MRTILLIATGGTIASVRTQQGLKPVLTSEELLAHLPELNELCCPDTLALCSIDSTDLGQEQGPRTVAGHCRCCAGKL